MQDSNYSRQLRKIWHKIIRRLNLVPEKGSVKNLGLTCDDTIIVSYPKSGNTWVRFLLANMLRPQDIITFRNIDTIVPDIYKVDSKVIKRSLHPRFIKTHDPNFQSPARVIYIYRDGRDVLVSYYHYAKGNGTFNGSFLEFLEYKYILNCHGEKWYSHVSKSLDWAEKDPEKFLLLRYEDMLAFPLENASKIAAFCQLGLSQAELQTAVEKCSFEKLRLIEKEYGPEYETVNTNFFRAGKSGQASAADLPPEALELFLKEAGPTLKRLNYIE